MRRFTDRILTRTLAPLLAVLFTVAVPVWGDDEDEFLNGVLLELFDGFAIEDVVARHPIRVLDGIPEWGVYQVEVVPPDDPVAVVAALLLDPAVEDAEDLERSLFAEGGQETIADLDLGLALIQYQTQPAVGAIGADAAGRIYHGAGKVVAVIDTSISFDHPVLQGAFVSIGVDVRDGTGSAALQLNGVDDDGDGVADEAAHHGTHVAGLIRLAAPQATILPIRALEEDGFGNTFDLTRAIMLATRAHVDVINLSIVLEQESGIVEKAVRRARNAGITVVVPAGNRGVFGVQPLAEANEAIAVAAVDDAGLPTAFTNFGENVDLSAPGSELISAYGNLDFARWSGTSFGAPLVSGAAAVLLERYPALDSDAVLEGLEQTATVTAGVPGPNGWMGAGVVDVDALQSYLSTDRSSLRIGTGSSSNIVWSTTTGATRYDVIRGDLNRLVEVATDIVSLGVVNCLYSGPVSGVQGQVLDEVLPDRGRAFFYLFRDDGQSSPWPGYGEDGDDPTRNPESGDCAG